MKSRRSPIRVSCSLSVAFIACVTGVGFGAQAAGTGARNAITMIVGYPAAADTETESIDSNQRESGKQSVVTQSAAASVRSPDAVNPRVIALAPLIDDAARTSGVDRALLMAVVDVESDGNPLAISPRGASGLMQLMPATGAQNGALDLLDPRENLRAGSQHLALLMRRLGNLPLALAAYNAGEAAVRRHGRQIPPYAETMDYVPRVIERYQRYRNIATAMPRGNSSQARFLLVRQIDE